MFGNIKVSVANSVINNIVRGIATNPDVQATAAGSALALVIAAQVNYGALLFQHDWGQIGILLAAICAWLLGKVANRNTAAKHIVDGLLAKVAALEAQAETAER